MWGVRFRWGRVTIHIRVLKWSNKCCPSAVKWPSKGTFVLILEPSCFQGHNSVIIKAV